MANLKSKEEKTQKSSSAIFGTCTIHNMFGFPLPVPPILITSLMRPRKMKKGGDSVVARIVRGHTKTNEH